MLWRKGCFGGTRMTCQDSSWHWNALPSPSTNTRKLITPLSLAATTSHPLWPPQLPQCCSFHGTPYAHLLPPISSREFPGHVSVPSCSFISSGPFHCQMPYKQLGPPLHIPTRPSGVGHTFRIYLGLCLIQFFPSQAFSRGTLQVSLTMAPSTV